MLRRFTSGRTTPRDASVVSDAVVPLTASLLVPVLVIVVLELPAGAIDRIASPVLGHLRSAARVPLPPADPQGPHGLRGRSAATAPPDRLVIRPRRPFLPPTRSWRVATTLPALVPGPRAVDPAPRARVPRWASAPGSPVRGLDPDAATRVVPPVWVDPPDRHDADPRTDASRNAPAGPAGNPGHD